MVKRFLEGGEEGIKQFEKELSLFRLALEKSKLNFEQKELLLRIYENVLLDKINSYMMWHDLFQFVQTNPREHAVHGSNLSKYMERVLKANDQLIKILDLVIKSNNQKNEKQIINEDKIYEAILSVRSKKEEHEEGEEENEG